MRKLSVLSIVAAGVLACSSAHAGVYADDLSKCLVKSASPADQSDLIRWVFSALALHPDIKSMANITDAQRNEMNRKTGALFERLLTVDCHTETVAALKYEGENAMLSGFQTLGQVAARGLFSAPEVTAGMSGLVSNVDTSKIEGLYKEAGIKK